MHLSSGNNINCTTLSGFDGDVLFKVLRGQPDIKQGKHPSKYDESLPEIEMKKKMTSEKHPTAESKAILSEKTDTELQAQKMPKQSYITIHEDIKEELRKGNHKVHIAPSDLVEGRHHLT